MQHRRDDEIVAPLDRAVVFPRPQGHVLHRVGRQDGGRLGGQERVEGPRHNGHIQYGHARRVVAPCTTQRNHNHNHVNMMRTKEVGVRTGRRRRSVIIA
jgi:hypothetical protein